MTEALGEAYETEKLEVSSEALEITESFITALNNFNWRADYFKFCEVLGFTPDSYAEEKYQQFRELVSYLDCFDKEAIAKMIEAGR
ncbi:hypothetical protein [Nostoc sp. FACHB-133]|uniref:hypothetical protein n=1 Tax=Nostoc sp. FACHB-133 TaxID=2692835 RepID=UPI001688CA1A|nr:hypothetical protein [Nostoc sp. FACHB-133]MBD2527459.1 hypothetical protein [Nostoc sp. FACHB-133]